MRKAISVLAVGAMLAACGGSEEGEGASSGTMTPTDSAGMAAQGAPIDPNAGTAPGQAGVDGGSGTADGTVNTTTGGPAATGTATTP